MDYQLWAWGQGDEGYELQPSTSDQQLLPPNDGDPSWDPTHYTAFNIENSPTISDNPLGLEDTSEIKHISSETTVPASTSLKDGVRKHLAHTTSRIPDPPDPNPTRGGRDIASTNTQSLWRHPLHTCIQKWRSLPATVSTFILLIFACGAVTCAIIYSHPTHATVHVLATTPSRSLLILRIISELCTIILWVLVTWMIEDFQWAFASRHNGIGILSFLSLDSGTRVWGMLRLLCMSSSQGGAHKRYSLLRLFLLLLIPVPGITIMSGLSIKPFFSTQYSYPIAAGLADFNSSTTQVLTSQGAMTFLFDISYPLWDRRVSFPMNTLGPNIGRCHSADNPSQWSACEESVLMTGGCLMISPQKDDLTMAPEASAYVVEMTKGYQVEFGPIHNQSIVRERGICKTQGYDIGAIHWCIALGDSQEILHTYNICPLSLMSQRLCFNNTAWTTTPFKFASSFYVYRRTATVSYSRSNLSIIAITDLSPPLTYILTAEEVAAVFDVIMRAIRFRKTAANSTDDARASDLALFMSGGLQQSDNPFLQKTALQESRKALAMLLHYFQANGIGAGELQSIWDTKTPRAGLPPDMYTTLQFAVPSYHVEASRLSLYLFIGVAGCLLLFCFTMSVFTCGTVSKWPWRTGFPSLDFAVYALPTRVRHQRLYRSIAEMREQRRGLGKLKDGRFVAE